VISSLSRHRKIFNVSVGKPERNTRTGRSRRRYYNIEINVNEIGHEDVDWTQILSSLSFRAILLFDLSLLHETKRYVNEELIYGFILIN
jgi:hypothetical protein